MPNTNNQDPKRPVSKVLASKDEDLDWHVETVENAIATIIFAHGAGANMHSDFIEDVSKQFLDLQLNVVRFNFPYMTQRGIDGKRRPPNKMDVLKESFQQVIDAVDARLPVFIGGKSMGSRVAAMLSEQEVVRGVFCLGYPFHPQKKPEKLRLEPLQEGDTPTLIIQGSRDALGNRDEIKEYLLGPNVEVVFVEDGDHDLKPRVKSGFTHQGHKQQAVNLIKAFIAGQIALLDSKNKAECCNEL